MNQHPQDHVAQGSDKPESMVPATEAEELSDLLDQARRAAVQLLSDFETPPKTLQVRAGEVTVEASWEDQPAGASAAATVVAAPSDGDADADADAEVEQSTRYLTAPVVGVFYPAPAPGASPFVDVGDSVSVGQQVAIIEAMKLMIPLEADKEGRVVEVLKETGQPVEYDEPVFALAGADEA